MEQQVLNYLIVFLGGVFFGALTVLAYNRFRSGAATPASIKQEYDEYQNRVEDHFEETSKRFKQMTEQYQDLYQHLAIGATSLCRPESAAAALVDGTKLVEGTKIEGENINAEKEPGSSEVVSDIEAQQNEAEAQTFSSLETASDKAGDADQVDLESKRAGEPTQNAESDESAKDKGAKKA